MNRRLYVFVVDDVPLIITWATITFKKILFLVPVFLSLIHFSEFDFKKYSFVYVTGHGPCCLLGIIDSTQGMMLNFMYRLD